MDDLKNLIIIVAVLAALVVGAHYAGVVNAEEILGRYGISIDLPEMHQQGRTNDYTRSIIISTKGIVEMATVRMDVEVIRNIDETRGTLNFNTDFQAVFRVKAGYDMKAVRVTKVSEYQYTLMSPSATILSVECISEKWNNQPRGIAFKIGSIVDTWDWTNDLMDETVLSSKEEAITKALEKGIIEKARSEFRAYIADLGSSLGLIIAVDETE